MGLTADINRLFRNPKNFDESGFARYELITESLKERLRKMSYSDRKELLADGYYIHLLDQDGTCLMIFKWFKDGNLQYNLKLYCDLRTKGENEDDRTGRTGTDQQPEADDPGTEQNR